MSVYVQQPAWSGAAVPPGGYPGANWNLDDVHNGFNFWEFLGNSPYIDSLSNPEVPSDQPDKDPPPRPVYEIPSKPVLPEYINAEFAKHYGMDVATAYQEALANTSHQREVRDLIAAGLNPALSARYSGASGVSGASVMESSSSRSSSRGEDSSSPLKFLGSLAILVGTVAGIATKNPKLGYGITNAVSAIDRILN